MKREVMHEGQIEAGRAADVVVDRIAMLALTVMSNSESPNGGTTNARSFAPLAISSPPVLKLKCRPLTGSARSFGFRMLSLTAKFCCSRLPPRISTDTTDTVGRLNLG